jgi:hypothetical protein
MTAVSMGNARSSKTNGLHETKASPRNAAIAPPIAARSTYEPERGAVTTTTSAAVRASI